MPYHFFPMIARMRYISRWGLMRNTDPENIQEHSHMVAVLAHALAVIQNEHFGGQTDPGVVAVAALYHDASEILTGDHAHPHQVRQPGHPERLQVGGGRGGAEAAVHAAPRSCAPPIDEALTIPDPEVRALVKAADKLSAYLKCVEELKAGNLEFQQGQGTDLRRPCGRTRCPPCATLWRSSSPALSSLWTS